MQLAAGSSPRNTPRQGRQVCSFSVHSAAGAREDGERLSSFCSPQGLEEATQGAKVPENTIASTPGTALPTSSLQQDLTSPKNKSIPVTDFYSFQCNCTFCSCFCWLVLQQCHYSSQCYLDKDLDRLHQARGLPEK